MPRTLAAFLRWTALAAPLPAAPEDPAPTALWRAAQRTIAARLALALARERLVDADLRGDHLELRPRAGALALPIARPGDLELHAPDLLTPRSPLLDDPTRLLDHVASDLALSPDTHHRLAHELADSAFNLALVRHWAGLRRRAAARGLPWPAPHDPESWVEDGHPWHPMTRTRLGLRTAEVLRHAPEHLARGDVALLDVRADLLAASGDALDRLAALAPPPPPGRLRVPVHRAQLPRLRRRLADRWGADITPAPLAPLPARALLSLRTVELQGPPLHLKLALDVTTTSARRTVSPMSVANGPPLTALLAEIQRRDPLARGDLWIQGDRAGVGLRPDLFGDRAAHLGVILRDRPDRLRADLPAAGPRDIWVCAALGERRPGADRPLLAALAAAYPTPRDLLRDYLHRLLPPLLRLFTAHGVALEAHLQNTLAVVERGRLRAFVVRDLGGLRIHRPRLRAAGNDMSFAPGSFILTDDLAEARDKLTHTLLHAHLAALLRWAEEHLGVPPAHGWARARAILDRELTAWAADPALAAACDHDRAALLAPRCRAKALFTMRLTGRSSDYSYVDLDNPLAHPDVARAAAHLAAAAR